MKRLVPWLVACALLAVAVWAGIALFRPYAADEEELFRWMRRYVGVDEWRATDGQLIREIARLDAVNYYSDRQNMPLLSAAIWEKRDEVVTWMLEHGAQINWDRGMSPLEIALLTGAPTIAEHLIARGADIHRAFYGGTLLHAVARSGDPWAVAALLQAGADAEAKDDTGRTPYEWAVELERYPTIHAFENAAAQEALD